MTVGQRAYLRISTIVNTTNMSIVNEANVSSETHDPDMSNNNDSDFVVIPPEAELDINKTAEPGKVHYGDTVVFTIVVNNNGPDNATNVVIGDVVPEQFKVTDCNDSSFIDNQIIVDELKVGQSYIFTITTIAVANGTWNNTASAFCTENNTKVEDNATVIVDPIADLSTTITSDKDEYYVGDIATWTITVHNAGNGTDAIGVILEEFFPSQYFDFIGAMTDNGTYDNESDEWDIGFMGNGTDVTLYIVGRAKAPGNHINNRVVVASDTDEWDYYNNFAYNYVDVLDIPKPVKSVDNSTPDYHDFVVYNLTIENTNGKDYEENLTVIDSLPDGLVFNETLGISGADLISEVVDGQTVTWTITNISAESSAVITVKVYVNAVVNLTNNLTKKMSRFLTLFLNDTKLLYVEIIHKAIIIITNKITAPITQPIKNPPLFIFIYYGRRRHHRQMMIQS